MNTCCENRNFQKVVCSCEIYSTTSYCEWVHFLESRLSPEDNHLRKIHQDYFNCPKSNQVLKNMVDRQVKRDYPSATSFSMTMGCYVIAL